MPENHNLVPKNKYAHALSIEHMSRLCKVLASILGSNIPRRILRKPLFFLERLQPNKTENVTGASESIEPLQIYTHVALVERVVFPQNIKNRINI